ISDAHVLARQVKADCLLEHRARSGKTRQPREVDVRIVSRVVTGDESWQHPGVRSLHDARDQGHAHATKRLRPKVLEDGNMGVAAADEYQPAKWKVQRSKLITRRHTGCCRSNSKEEHRANERRLIAAHSQL